ncbi:hypothetical protein [Agromyces sp. ZXT2-6]|uniref:hypothetical protein n=1 Tax=Agromyces sp. ZXT2-6 TaxID=3461153 RepID=UPI004055075A
MTPPRSRARRALHGLAAASLATFVALASHVLAGGEPPSWVGVLAPWTLSVAASTLLAGRTLSLARLSAAVLVSQGLFHALFTLGAAPAAGTAVAGAHAGHAHGAASAIDLTAVAASADAGMWGWHAVAAAVTIVALHQAERVLGLLATLAARVARWVVAVLPAPPRSEAPARVRSGVPGIRVLLPAGVFPAARPLRGPPLLGSL